MGRSHRWRFHRRGFLGAAGIATASAFLAKDAARPRVAFTRPSTDSAAARTFRWETVPPAGGGESIVFEAPFPFNAVGVFWTGAAKSVEVRMSSTRDLGDWTTVNVSPSGRQTAGPNITFGELIVTTGAQYIQYRVAPGAAGVTKLSCELIDSSAGPNAPVRRASAASIILRQQWGCDESLRFSNGEEIWPVEYVPVQKIIIHHTVDQNDLADPAAAVRAIYYYHCVTRGWGDIGYNLLIDQRGNIYEGRYGGPGAVAGHAEQYNPGSTGIAMIGNYDERYVTSDVEQAIGGVVGANFGSIDPYGSGFFIDDTFPNVAGHRDYLETDCPGNLGYKQIANFRDTIARIENKARPQAQIASLNIAGNTTIGGQIRVDIEVWNNSSQTLTTQGPDPGFNYKDTDNSGTIGQLGQLNCWRVGIDAFDNTTGKLYPYRWGLGNSLAPGERVIVRGYVTLSKARDTWWWAGLIQEAVAIRADLINVTKVVAFQPTRTVYVPAAQELYTGDN
jgi:hypothetical protein